MDKQTVTIGTIFAGLFIFCTAFLYIVHTAGDRMHGRRK